MSLSAKRTRSGQSYNRCSKYHSENPEDSAMYKFLLMEQLP